MKPPVVVVRRHCNTNQHRIAVRFKKIQRVAKIAQSSKSTGLWFSLVCSNKTTQARSATTMDLRAPNEGSSRTEIIPLARRGKMSASAPCDCLTKAVNSDLRHHSCYGLRRMPKQRLRAQKASPRAPASTGTHGGARNAHHHAGPGMAKTAFPIRGACEIGAASTPIVAPSPTGGPFDLKHNSATDTEFAAGADSISTVSAFKLAEVG